MAEIQDQLCSAADGPISKTTGFFTISMDTIESCVSFLLEIVLSGIGSPAPKVANGPASQLIIARGDSKGCFRSNSRAKGFWLNGIKLLLRLLDDEDLLILSRGHFRASGEEKTTMFSRQWYTHGERFRNGASVQLRKWA